MKTRQQISDEIKAKQRQVEQLKLDIQTLWRESLLLCDEKQWFEEKMETNKVREGRKLVEKQWLIGRIHWVENFRDEDTGEVIPVNRTRIIRVNGNWDY